MSDKLKVVFAPGCFDEFKGTQEELEEFMTAIQQAVADPDFLANSQAVDLATIADEDPELAAILDRQLNNLPHTRH